MKSLLITILLSTLIACNIGAGSFPYVEKYEFEMEETDLIEAINNFKKKNPQYNVPIELQLVDERDSHWYHIYFYFPEENQILHTWTRSTKIGKTTFAYVSVNEGLTLGNWKHINKDFSASENEKQKKLFEERIVKQL